MKKLLPLVLICPGFFQLLLNVSFIPNEWINVPRKMASSLKAKITHQYFTYLTDFRWGDSSLHRNNILPKLIYNPGLFLLNETFDYLQFLTPRLYFVSGDGSIFSPKGGVEIIPSVLFPFWMMGVAYLINKNKFKLILLAGAFAFLAYLSGIKNLGLLFPLALIYLEISRVGLESIENSYMKKLAWRIVIIYGIYVVGVWLYQAI